MRLQSTDGPPSDRRVLSLLVFKVQPNTQKWLFVITPISSFLCESVTPEEGFFHDYFFSIFKVLDK